MYQVKKLDNIKKDMIKPQTLKGFRDFLPEETIRRQKAIEKIRKVFELFGFDPLETPAIEYADVLLGKYGEEADKLLYLFEDRGGRKVGLRYDQTVPAARVVAQYPNLPKPFKRYQIQPVWRAENPQKGRFREFLQCDIDIFGTLGLLADSEVIACVLTVAKALGFPNAKMLINDRSVFIDLKPKFIAAIDKLEKIGKKNVVSELITKGMSDQDAQKLVSSFEDKKPTPDVLTVFNYLKNYGLEEFKDFQFKANLARGLDYYTGTIFELVLPDYQAGSIGGGGRYDNLIGQFTGNNCPAVGFAFGFDRIIEAIDQLGLSASQLTNTKILITIFSPELKNQSIALALKLRNAGINTEIYFDSADRLDKQLKYADKKGIPYAAIIGPDEAKNKTVTLKNLKERSQKPFSFDELTTLLAQST